MVLKGGEFQADAFCHQFMSHFVPKGLHLTQVPVFWAIMFSSIHILTRSDRSIDSKVTSRSHISALGASNTLGRCLGKCYNLGPFE